MQLYSLRFTLSSNLDARACSPGPDSPAPSLASELLPRDASHPHAPIASRSVRIRARGSPLHAIPCIQQYVKVILSPLVLIHFTDSAYCYSASVHTGGVCVCAASLASNGAFLMVQLCEHLAPRRTVTAGDRGRYLLPTVRVALFGFYLLICYSEPPCNVCGHKSSLAPPIVSLRAPHLARCCLPSHTARRRRRPARARRPAPPE